MVEKYRRKTILISRNLIMALLLIVMMRYTSLWMVKVIDDSFSLNILGKALFEVTNY